MNPFEKDKEAHTPEQMRAEIARLRRENVIVYRVMDMADIAGFDGEDRYTFLAYHALVGLENCKEAHLAYAMRNPEPAVIKVIK